MYSGSGTRLDGSGDEGKVIGRLKEGEQFGDMALLRSAIRTASVKCTDFCDIFVLGSRELQVRLCVCTLLMARPHPSRWLTALRLQDLLSPYPADKKQIEANVKSLLASTKGVGAPRGSPGAPKHRK